MLPRWPCSLQSNISKITGDIEREAENACPLLDSLVRESLPSIPGHVTSRTPGSCSSPCSPVTTVCINPKLWLAFSTSANDSVLDRAAAGIHRSSESTPKLERALPDGCRGRVPHQARERQESRLVMESRKANHNRPLAHAGLGFSGHTPLFSHERLASLLPSKRPALCCCSPRIPRSLSFPGRTDTKPSTPLPRDRPHYRESSPTAAKTVAALRAG